MKTAFLNRLIKHQDRWLRLVLVLVLGWIGIGSTHAQMRLAEGEEKCVSGCKKPDWIYQSGEYIAGISQPCATEADARSNALLDGRKQIVDRLGVLLTKDQHQRIFDQATAGSGNIVSTLVEDDIQTHAFSQGLVAVKADKYHIEKYARMHMGEVRYYYLAYARILFSKSAHDEFIRTSFQTVQKLFDTELQQIRLLQGPDIVTLIGKLDGLEQTCARTRQWVGLKPEFQTTLDSWSNELQALKSTRLADISALAIGSDQVVDENRQLPGPIGVRVTYQNQALKGIAVVLYKQDREIARGITDEQGEFRYRYTEPIFRPGKITVSISITDRTQLPALALFFDHSVPMVVNIPERAIESGQEKNAIQGAILSWLARNGYTLNKGCTLADAMVVPLLQGQLSLIPDSSCLQDQLLLIGRGFGHDVHAMSLNDRLFEAKATAELQLIDPRTRTILWNLTLTEQSGFAISPIAAAHNALDKLAQKTCAAMDSTFLK